MAKYKPNGALSGLIGGLVIVEGNDTQIVRTRPKKRKDKSPKIKKARENFGYMIYIMKTIKPLSDIGFRNASPKRSAYHYGLSVNTNNYLEAKRLEQTDKYAWIKLSEGKWSGAGEISVNLSPNGTIKIAWAGTEKGREFHKDDQAFAGVFIRSSGKFFIGPKKITREDGTMSFAIEKLPLDEKVDVFLFFEHHEGTGCSNSQWREAVVSVE